MLTQHFPNRLCVRDLAVAGRTGELCCAPLGTETVPVFERSPWPHCQQPEYEENRVSPCVDLTADKSFRQPVVLRKSIYLRVCTSFSEIACLRDGTRRCAQPCMNSHSCKLSSDTGNWINSLFCDSLMELSCS